MTHIRGTKPVVTPSREALLAELDRIDGELRAMRQRAAAVARGDMGERTTLDRAPTPRLGTPPRPPELARAPTATSRPGFGGARDAATAARQIGEAEVRTAALAMSRLFHRPETAMVEALIEVMREDATLSVTAARDRVAYRIMTRTM